jgi:hypothetical protein
MGMTYEDLKSGVMDIGSIVNNGLSAFEKLSGRASVTTTTASTPQPPAPSAPAESKATQSPAGGPTGTGQLPGWLVLAGVGLGAWWLAKRQRR